MLVVVSMRLAVGPGARAALPLRLLYQQLQRSLSIYVAKCLSSFAGAASALSPADLSSLNLLYLRRPEGW